MDGKEFFNYYSKECSPRIGVQCVVTGLAKHSKCVVNNVLTVESDSFSLVGIQ